MDRIKELSSYAALAETVSAGIDSGIIASISQGEDIPANLEEKTVELLMDVLTAGKIVVRTENEITLSVPSFPFFSQQDVLMRYFSSEGRLYDDIMKSLRMDKCDPERNAPEPEWNKRRLSRIAVSAASGEADAVAEKASVINPYGSLLDLGSGHGLYAAAFKRKHPELKVTASDLPEVIPVISEMLSLTGNEGIIGLLSLDFMKENIPAGAFDSILCANILHEEKRDRVLSNVFNALPSGGTVVIDARVCDAPLSLEGAVRALEWHVRGKGNLISSAEYLRLLEGFGFKDARICGFHELHCIITAKKTG